MPEAVRPLSYFNGGLLFVWTWLNTDNSFRFDILRKAASTGFTSSAWYRVRNEHELYASEK